MQHKFLFRAWGFSVLLALTRAENTITARTPVANGASLRVLPLGDSITHGYLSSDNNGYRLELWNDLSENTKDFIGTQAIGNMQDPDNEGYNGATIAEISSKCGAALDMRPNVVLLHAGTNDMNNPTDPDTAPDRLGALIDKIITTCPDAAILVAKIIPAANADTMARITTYNSQIPDIVAARADKGKQVMIVDMTVLTTAELNDGLHPTDAGYKHMGDIWYSAIVQAGENGWIEDPVPGLVLTPGTDGGSCSLLPVWYPQNEIASGVGSSEGFTSVWFPKGEIASGIGAGTGVRFGDIDGDGRDDYLWVDDEGAVTAYLNTAGASADDVVWMPQGVIASGIGEDGDGVRFADMNGDGRDDYLWVSDDGRVTCYLNTAGDSAGKPTWVPKGEIASGVGSPRDRILFGDINNDGRDDYLTIGDNGEVNAWLNTGTGDTPVWVPQGQIASGIGAAAGVRIADLNKDGRADYIWLSDEGAATLYTNTVGTGGILWWPQGVVATGVGAPRANLTFADLNGDGLSDYVSIGANGEVSEWQNGGSGGVSQIGPGVQFQDLDGDGYDDYLSVDAEGKVVAYLNGGVIDNKQIWYPQGEIATGVGATREQVRFGDLDGDGRAEYLFVHDDGSVDSWRNLGSDDGVTWHPQGQVASGIGQDGKGVRFADLNGDGRDDYLYVSDSGAVTAYLNAGGDADHPTWIPQGVIATGVGGKQADIQFADINGDGRAEYLWINPDDGSVQCWYNAGSPSGNDGADAGKVTWIPWGTIATGVGTEGRMIRFGDISGDGRADYLAVTSDDTGATSEWLNGCDAATSPAPPGAIKDVDAFCAVLTASGDDPKTVENWQAWGIDTALSNFIDNFKPGGAKGAFRTNIQDSLLALYDPDVLDRISYKCNPPATCDMDVISQAMCKSAPELTFIFWAIQNFNNYCVQIAQGLINSGTIAIAKTANIIEDFAPENYDDSDLSAGFSLVNALLTVFTGYQELEWAASVAAPAGFAGIGSAALGFGATEIPEPKFDEFANITNQMGDFLKLAADAADDLAVHVLDDTPVNDPDNGKAYSDDTQGLIKIFQNGGFAEPIKVPAVPDRVLAALTSDLINEVWKPQKPFVIKTTVHQTGMGVCAALDQWKDNIYCDGEDIYVLAVWQDAFFHVLGTVSPLPSRLFIGLDGKDKLDDYDMSLELIIRSAMDWQSATGDFGAVRTKDRMYQYLLNLLDEGLEDYQTLLFDMPVCDLAIAADVPGEDRPWPADLTYCSDEQQDWCKIGVYAMLWCPSLVIEGNEWPWENDAGTN
ncbi:hypothetical protein BJX99DRAFT_264439 [Aspergillus californicus]